MKHDTKNKKENWDKIREEVRTRWSQLTDSEIESLKGNMDEIVNILQAVYGYAKDEAEREYKEFKHSLGNVWNEMKENKYFGFVALVSLLALLTATAVLSTSIILRKKRVN